jgi:hypothetical protein
MLVALIVVFLVSLAISLVGLSLEVRLRTARVEARGTTLTALCDAAVAEALAGLAAGQTSGIAEHPFGSGTIGSQVQILAAQNYRITATASFAGKSRTVVATAVSNAQGTSVVHWQRLPG